MPMPTTSPLETVSGFQRSRVSSVTIGSPYDSGVAAASTYSHRGVMTPTPNDRLLGLMRCTFIQTPSPIPVFASLQLDGCGRGAYCVTSAARSGLEATERDG